MVVSSIQRAGKLDIAINCNTISVYPCFLPKFSLMLVELNLARNVKGKQKRFYKYINSKRKTKENTAALLNGAAAPVTKDTEEPEVLNGISASVFTVKTGFKEYQVPETRGKFWSKALLSVEDQVREHLNRLNIHKAMGPDGMPLQVLRELADVIARSLSIISERLWGLRESHEDWKKADIIPIFRKEDWGTTGWSASPQFLGK